MEERHANEQYFFDQPTLTHLTGFVAEFPNPCCLCTPRLGEALERRGVQVRTLDIDERFATLRGFRRYDLTRPEWLGESYGLILCDTPFFNVSLTQLLKAIRTLSHHTPTQPLLVAYLVRRAPKLLQVFEPFNLQPTGYHPGYATVQKVARNDIAFYGNLAPHLHERLRTG